MTKKMLISTLVFVSLGLGTSQAWADLTFHWYPNSPFAIGRCIDMRDMSIKQDAFVDSEVMPVERGFRSVQILTKQVESFEDVARERYFDLSIAGGVRFKLLSLGGSASASATKSLTTKRDALQFIFKAEQDFGRWDRKQWQLTNEAKQLAEHPDEFVRRYGNYYVVQSRRVCTVIAHVIVSNISRDTRRALEANIKTSGKFASIFKGQSNTSFREKLRQLDKEGKIQVRYYATGGDGKIDHVRFDDLEGTLKFMERYVKQISSQNAPAVEYRLASFENFGIDIPPTDPAEWAFYKQAYLVDNRYAELQARIASEIEILRHAGAANFHAKLTYFKNLQSQYSKTRLAIADAVRSAKKSGKYPRDRLEQLRNHHEIEWLLEPVKTSDLEVTVGLSDNQFVDRIAVHVDLRLSAPEFVQSLRFFKYDANGNRVILTDAKLVADSKGERRSGLIDAMHTPTRQDDDVDPAANVALLHQAAETSYYMEVELRSGIPVVVELGRPDLTKL